MKKYLFFPFLPLMIIFGIIPTFCQEKTASPIHIFGYLKNSGNEPAVQAQVCVRSGWTQSSRVACTMSQANGSFTLDVSRAEANNYSFLCSTFYNNPNEWLVMDVPKLQITNLQSSSNLTDLEIRVELKLSIPNKPHEDNRQLNSAKVKLCQIDKPRLCNVSSLVFWGNGSYEFNTSSSAYSISIKLWDGRNSVEWIAVDNNNKQSKPLRIKFGTGDNLVQIKAGIEEK
jgi:hypothetical protein